MRRSRLAPLLAGLLLCPMVGGIDTAAGCSCVGLDPERRLSEVDGAFIGTLVEREAVGAPISRCGGASGEVELTVRVEEVVKGKVGSQVAIRTSDNGGSCGIEVPVGGRSGLFLRAGDDGWESSLCDQVSSLELRRAAGP